jgi:hydroxymethylpyrimidine kinase/phosphomethylpyrimidine kinase
MERKKIALTIAGSDSSAGAGIQADLKTFSALKIYGISVITAITAQNTVKISKVFQVPSEIIEAQLDLVIEDFSIDAVKTGMLVSSEVIELIADKLTPLKVPLVVDPIIQAGTGRKLLENSAINSLISTLFPIATIITPNIYEAETFSGIKLNNESDLMRAGKKMIQQGAQAVLIKGGHFISEKVIDLLILNDGTLHKFEKARVPNQNRHGSGCVLSAAITANLAKGAILYDAIIGAEQYMEKIFPGLLKIGHGTPPIDPFHNIY